MKKQFRLLSLILAVILCVSALPTARASEIQPRYTYINTLATSITFDEDGYAVCYGKVIAMAVTPVKVVCKLQKYVNGAWLTLKTWTDTGTAMACVSEKYRVASGSIYRVYTTGYILDSNGYVLESDYLVDTKLYS